MSNLNIKPQYFFYVAMMVVLHYEVSRLIGSFQVVVDDGSPASYYENKAIKHPDNRTAFKRAYGRDLKVISLKAGKGNIHHRHINLKRQ